MAEVGRHPLESLVRGERARVHLEDPRPVRRRQRLGVHLRQQDPKLHDIKREVKKKLSKCNLISAIEGKIKRS